MEFTIIGALLALLALWILSVRRRLVRMDENVNNAMKQIGVLLTSCFHALTALLQLTQEYAADESHTMMETVRSRCNRMIADASPHEVAEQKKEISRILDSVAVVTRQHPELKADRHYAKCMNALDSYRKLVDTGCLIYNDSVTKLNRELRLFPAFLLARMFGFVPREYMVAYEENAI